jgi:hypothetical protein
VTVGGFGLPLRRNEKSADPPVTGVFELLNYCLIRRITSSAASEGSTKIQEVYSCMLDFFDELYRLPDVRKVMLFGLF